MHDFQLYIEDSRYTVPTLRLIAVADIHHAQEVARAILADSPFHLAVEIFSGGVKVATLKSAPP